jgi:hypothetical protein
MRRIWANVSNAGMSGGGMNIHLRRFRSLEKAEGTHPIAQVFLGADRRKAKMSQRQAIYKTTAVFPEPNHTQTPNNFFDMIPDMSDAELRVTLIMIRNTFGWHRDGFKMGINKLADAAGLSRNGTKDGAEAAEKRGSFRRVNPDAQTEAEWELVVGQQETPSASDQGDGQPVTTPPSASEGQVGVKERLNKQLKRESPALDFKNMSVSEARKVPTLRMYAEATEFFPGSVVWEFVHDEIMKHKLTPEKIRAAAVVWAARGFKPSNVQGILEWAVNGIPAGKNGVTPTPQPRERDDYGPLIEYLNSKESQQ